MNEHVAIVPRSRPAHIRAAAGSCDVAESCTGLSAACPADGFVASSVVCRAPVGACDLAETCTGGCFAVCP